MNELNDLIGFVNGNNIRQKVLSLLSSKGEMEGKRLSKTLRVAHPTIAKTLEELEENMKDAYMLMTMEDVPENHGIKEFALTL